MEIISSRMRIIVGLISNGKGRNKDYEILGFDIAAKRGFSASINTT